MEEVTHIAMADSDIVSRARKAKEILVRTNI